MLKPQNQVGVALLALTLLALACNLPVASPHISSEMSSERRGDEMGGEAITVSEIAARRAERKIDTAVTLATQGRGFVLTLTQQEVTSWLAQRVETYARYADEDMPLESVHVYLDEGLVRLYVIHRAGPVVTDVLVTVALTMTPTGRLDARVVTVQAGPVDLGEALLESITQVIRARFDAILARGYRIAALSIDDGLLTLAVTAAR